MDLVPEDMTQLKIKRFRVINEGFICGNCGRKVHPTTCGTPRNHCPFCLYSMHVDINVGDRANPCRGLMKPIGILRDSKKGEIAVHKCTKCYKKTRSKVIKRGDIEPDDYDIIVELSTKPLRD